MSASGGVGAVHRHHGGRHDVVQVVIQGRDLGQSVSSNRAASQWTAWMAAWSWKGPGRLRRMHRRTRAGPCLISGWSQRVRSCSRNRTRSSGRTWAGTRASHRSISAKTPSASGSSGIRSANTRARRIASLRSSPCTGSSPLALQIRYSTDSTARIRAGSSASPGSDRECAQPVRSHPPTEVVSVTDQASRWANVHPAT